VTKRTVFVRTAVLSNLVEVAQSLNFDARPLLRAHGLPAALLADRDHKIPVELATQLLEEAAQLSCNESFGLLMAQRRQLADFGAVSLLLIHQPTIRSMLSILQRYQYLMNQSLLISVEEFDDVVVIREELVFGGDAGTRQATELAVGVLHRMFAMLFGSQWRPQEVHFKHDAPSDLSIHRSVFAVPVRFRSEISGVVCSASDLDRLNPQADVEMARYAQRYLDSLLEAKADSIVEEVRNALVNLIPGGRFALVDVADHLGMQVRQLQRQLSAAGTTYGELLSGVRTELACQYLRNSSSPLADISEYLGFASPSVFARWFRRNVGETPSSWRNLAGQSSV